MSIEEALAVLRDLLTAKGESWLDEREKEAIRVILNSAIVPADAWREVYAIATDAGYCGPSGAVLRPGRRATAADMVGDWVIEGGLTGTEIAVRGRASDAKKGG